MLLAVVARSTVKRAVQAVVELVVCKTALGKFGRAALTRH